MANRLILHAGQHKTGSTSIQRYLGVNSAALNAMGIAVCADATPDLLHVRTTPLPANAMFIANAVIRSSLMTPVRIKGSCQAMRHEDAISRLRAVNGRLRALPDETVVLSAEALAFLREPDEMRRLDVLCDGLEWRVVMFLREPGSWLASWKTQVIHSRFGDAPETTPADGIFDFKPSSWLVDHAAIRAFWGRRGTFLDYEQAVSTDRSVIPAFLTELGLNPAACPPWDKFFFNTSRAKLNAAT